MALDHGKIIIIQANFTSFREQCLTLFVRFHWNIPHDILSMWPLKAWKNVLKKVQESKQASFTWLDDTLLIIQEKQKKLATRGEKYWGKSLWAILSVSSHTQSGWRERLQASSGGDSCLNCKIHMSFISGYWLNMGTLFNNRDRTIFPLPRADRPILMDSILISCLLMTFLLTLLIIA